MIKTQPLPMLGILGGMGPLASAEFLKTLYEYNLLGKQEQDSPRIIVYSDPSFPDRTEVLIKGDYQDFLRQLTEALSKLCEFNVSKIVICCITSHYLLPKLPQPLKQRIISLVDVILNQLLKTSDKHLLICTKGTQTLKIFQNHPLWNQAKDAIVLLEDSDQTLVHQMIYALKVGGKHQECFTLLKTLKNRYNTQKFIVGCTEIHLLSKNWENQVTTDTENNPFLDPLTLIAKDLNEYLLGTK